MRLYLSIIGLSVLSTIGWMGCTAPDKYAAENKTMDSLMTAINEQVLMFDSLDRAAILAHIDTIMSQVKHVQTNFVGEMKITTATMIAEYKKLKGNLPDEEEAFEKIEKEIEFTKQQLENLKKLIADKATADATGAPIDDAYIKKAFYTEKTAAEDLIAKLKRMQIKNGTFFAEYDSLYPTIKALVDSIPVNPNAIQRIGQLGEEEEKD